MSEYSKITALHSRLMEDVESGKISVCIMKDLTRRGRDYLQAGNAMEIFRRNNVRFIAVNNGIDSEKPDTLEFAPLTNIMSEWYAKDISKKVKTGIKTKGMSRLSTAPTLKRYSGFWKTRPSDAPTWTGRYTHCRACFSVRTAAQKCTSA